MLGWIQIIGAALVLWFNKDVFRMASGPSIAIAILAVLFLIVGLHHLGEKEGRKH